MKRWSIRTVVTAASARNQRGWPARFGCLALVGGIALSSIAVATDPPSTVDEIFLQIALPSDPPGHAEYLKRHAGKPFRGAGRIEAVMARTFFDTSVPDSNPAVALLQLDSQRKVVCGLPRPLGPEDQTRYPQGQPMEFEGLLVDAQDWGEWKTVYLGDCSLRPAAGGKVEQ